MQATKVIPVLMDQPPPEALGLGWRDFLPRPQQPNNNVTINHPPPHPGNDGFSAIQAELIVRDIHSILAILKNQSKQYVPAQPYNNPPAQPYNNPPAQQYNNPPAQQYIPAPPSAPPYDPPMPQYPPPIPPYAPSAPPYSAFQQEQYKPNKNAA